MICSTLSGMLAIKHPTLGVLVREDGMVFNRVKGCNGSRSYNYKWTNGSINSHSGYHYVMIRGNRYRVHRLVAEAFIKNPENKPTVDHINRIRNDNRVCNLRWATHKEQNENSSTVLNRADYGVRYCENFREYDKKYRIAHREDIRARRREYYKSHREEFSEYARKYQEKKKQDRLAAKESQ